MIVVEVLSDSTESYDRGVEAGHYRRIPSIREYVLVSPHSPLVEVWRKNDQDRWEVASVAGEGESAALASLDIVIDVDAVYRQPPAT
jgi:Uma2 family endonuclease